MYGFFGFFANSVIFCPPVYGSAAHNFHNQRRNRRLGMVGNNLSAAIITVLGPSPIFSTCGRNTASHPALPV